MLESNERLADLLAPVSVSTFETEYWEQKPLLVHREALPDAFVHLLGIDDLPDLSAQLEALDIQPQIMRDGQKCEPREMLWDYLDGGSTVLNRVDKYWPPIGRLCAALRADFLHIFAVMYLTPRDSRAVPAHTDDQDVFILQLAGYKEWTVYGSPIELPYENEMLGKTAPISSRLWDSEALREPVLTAELGPGSLLYLPRGAVHQARAPTKGGSLHITLTVQTSDLCWSSFMRDGLVDLHRTLDPARRALPLDAAFGGWDEEADGAEDSGSSPIAAATGVGAPAVESVTTGVGAMDVATSAEASASEEAALALATFDELMACTAERADDAFDAAMLRLEAKLAHYNGDQDGAILAAQAVEDERPSGRLPDRLTAAPDIEIGSEPGGVLVCYSQRRDATMRTRLGSLPPDVVDAIATLARRPKPFTPAELPATDGFEQVAACARLLALQVLCDADQLPPRNGKAPTYADTSNEASPRGKAPARAEADRASPRDKAPSHVDANRASPRETAQSRGAKGGARGGGRAGRSRHRGRGQ